MKLLEDIFLETKEIYHSFLLNLIVHILILFLLFSFQIPPHRNQSRLWILTTKYKQ